MGKHVVFDVVGTCVDYDVFFNAIELRLGQKLRAEGIKPKLLGYAWIEAASREYTYLSISGRHIASGDVWRALFYRVLLMAGIEAPRKFATDDDREYIMQQYTKLTLRSGLKECFQKLRGAGVSVSCLTTGDPQNVRRYFLDGGVEMPVEDITSCNAIGVAKPSPSAYKPLLENIQKHGGEAWFAAAHMWDVSAAKRSGFLGAYCTIWEKEPCVDLFGEMDVMADTLPELADGIISYVI